MFFQGKMILGSLYTCTNPNRAFILSRAWNTLLYQKQAALFRVGNSEYGSTIQNRLFRVRQCYSAQAIKTRCRLLQSGHPYSEQVIPQGTAVLSRLFWAVLSKCFQNKKSQKNFRLFFEKFCSDLAIVRIKENRKNHPISPKQIFLPWIQYKPNSNQAKFQFQSWQSVPKNIPFCQSQNLTCSSFHELIVACNFNEIISNLKQL